jgi:hypothetical protein
VVAISGAPSACRSVDWTEDSRPIGVLASIPTKRIVEMQRSARSRADQKFAKSVHQNSDAAKEREKADRAVREKTTRLRALRLAKEATDREEADAKKLAKAARAARPKGEKGATKSSAAKSGA